MNKSNNNIKIIIRHKFQKFDKNFHFKRKTKPQATILCRFGNFVFPNFLSCSAAYEAICINQFNTNNLASFHLW